MDIAHACAHVLSVHRHREQAWMVVMDRRGVLVRYEADGVVHYLWSVILYTLCGAWTLSPVATDQEVTCLRCLTQASPRRTLASCR